MAVQRTKQSQLVQIKIGICQNWISIPEVLFSYSKHSNNIKSIVLPDNKLWAVFDMLWLNNLHAQLF